MSVKNMESFLSEVPTLLDLKRVILVGSPRSAKSVGSPSAGFPTSSLTRGHTQETNYILAASIENPLFIAPG